MIAVDTHTHSISSGHAYSSLEEMAKAASDRGLPGFALTDHAPAMPAGAHVYHFNNLRVLPRTIHGVTVFHGAETNIMNMEGEIDLPEITLDELEIVIASLHVPTYPPESVESHTTALVNTMKNPYVKIIGHPDDSRYPYDIQKVVTAAGETGTLLEMNNTSLNPNGFRKGAEETYRILLNECRKQGVMITLGSDAHYSSYVGEVGFCQILLEELDFPRELIANISMERFLDLLKIET